MFMIKKGLLITLIIVGKVIAIPIIVLLQAVLLLSSSCEKLARLVLGLFNLAMVVAFIYCLANKNYDLVKDAGFIFLVESGVLVAYEFAKGSIQLVMGFFMEILKVSLFSKRAEI